MSATGFNDAALDYFEAHAIDPEIASVLGIADTPKGVSIPYRDGMGRETYRRDRDFAAKKTYQPKGKSVDIWTPVGTPGGLLVFESESDCMAAISALFEVDHDLLADPNFADDGPAVLLRRKPNLPEPLKEATPVALPGAGACHRQLADLAEGLISDVVLVLDGDDTGRREAAKLADELRGRRNVRVSVARLPDELDVADVLAAGDDPTGALAELIAEAEIVDAEEAEQPEQPAEDGDKPKPTQSQVLLKLAREDGVECWATPEGLPYITVPVDGHREHHRLGERGSRDWLARRFYEEQEKAPSAQALQDAIGVLRGEALWGGAERREVYVRHAAVGDAIYVDLGDADWRAVEVDAHGWRIVTDPPVRFRRPRGMLPLPEPERGANLNAVLRPLLNVDDDGWKLVVGFLVGTMAPAGPYPLLGLHGEMGTAKSSAARTLRGLIDPNVAPLRSEPRDERDLVIAASNGRIVALDNVSHLPPSLSDALCRLATGGGFATRELYSDSEEVIFSETRPAIITGIGDVATRGDLIDRTIAVTLEPIPEGDRLTEATLRERFEDRAPHAFGALLTAASTALRRLPEVSLERLPRMADHARWVEAAAPALGWESGSYIAVYDSMRRSAVETALEASPLTEPLRTIAVGGREGTATELLAELAELVGDQVARSRSWPKSARGLSAALRRLAPDLRSQEFVEIDEGQTTGANSRKLWTIRTAPGFCDASDAPTQDTLDSAFQSDSGRVAKCVANQDASQTASQARRNGTPEIPHSRAKASQSVASVAKSPTRSTGGCTSHADDPVDGCRYCRALIEAAA